MSLYKAGHFKLRISPLHLRFPQKQGSTTFRTGTVVTALPGNTKLACREAEISFLG